MFDTETLLILLPVAGSSFVNTMVSKPFCGSNEILDGFKCTDTKDLNRGQFGPPLTWGVVVSIISVVALLLARMPWYSYIVFAIMWSIFGSIGTNTTVRRDLERS